MAKKKLNIGMIGYGFMGRAHSNAFRKVNNFFQLEHQCVLQAVCARDAAKVKAFAENWGYQSIETDWRKLIARPDIHAIDICTPNDLHREIAIAAGVVDNSEQPKDEKDRQVVRLDLVARSDGKQVEAREAPGFDCTKALKENADNRDVARELTGALDERIRKVCATRGDWRWTAGTLRRGPVK